MAKVTNNISQPVAKTTITLKLSQDEARVLVTLMGNIGGDPDTTMRMYTQPVYDALTSLGIRCFDLDNMVADRKFMYCEQFSENFVEEKAKLWLDRQ